MSFLFDHAMFINNTDWLKEGLVFQFLTADKAEKKFSLTSQAA